ncbi:MAG: serine/threonine protein kinase [Bacteroidales bacterium]|nr:serine/threonine protein kinase [Bacteroidales bacterium]MBE6234273.1 serine/threonine protein kinase [Bacteroidales bacterium]
MRISSGLSGAPQENMYDGITVLGTISEGRFFRVLKARMGTKHIILKSAVHKDAMTTEFLRREYELGSTLSHSCIVTTLGFEEDTPAGPALILEYIEGVSLEDYIATYPTDSATDRVIDDILDGVDYLHHRGVLHNDIKPSNIMVNPHGAARIIDFGLSLSDDSVYKGCMGGSQGYSAPEIMAGKGPAGAASDIYSIGLLMRLLSGRKYRRVIDRCCRQNPFERYQSIPSLKRAIALRRHLPVAAAAVMFAVFVLTMILPSKVETAVTKSSHNALKDRLRTEMSTFYIPARDSMFRQTTFYAASIFDGEYLMSYVHFRDSLPADQRLACEEIFAEQSAVLDSIMLSLPGAPVH